MARIRTIKPEFFKHYDLWVAETEEGLPLRVAFAGLWCVADREGRFKWRPQQLKIEILPYDEVDFSLVMEALAARGFVKSYESDGARYGFIPTWTQHQRVNIREAHSDLPDPGTCTHVQARAQISHREGINITPVLRTFILKRDGHRCARCQSEDDLTVDHIFPRCVGGTHAETNLRTLCRGCNSSRPVQGDGLLQDLALDGLTMDDMQRICTHVHARSVNGNARGEGKGREEERTYHEVSKQESKR